MEGLLESGRYERCPARDRAAFFAAAERPAAPFVRAARFAAADLDVALRRLALDRA
jgi:hypothetical protein